MKFGLFIFIVLLGSISLTKAAVSISINSKHQDHPGECWDSHEKVSYAIGVHNPEGACMEINCTEDFKLIHKTCGVIDPPKGYRNEHDYSKPYPDCCVKLVKERNDSEIESAPSSGGSE